MKANGIRSKNSSGKKGRSGSQLVESICTHFISSRFPGLINSPCPQNGDGQTSTWRLYFLKKSHMTKSSSIWFQDTLFEACLQLHYHELCILAAFACLLSHAYAVCPSEFPSPHTHDLNAL